MTSSATTDTRAGRLLVDVPALTLLNPWAHLVAHHGKDVENRSWMPPESVDRFMIHAGKGWDDGASESVRRRFGIEVDGVQPSVVVAVADLAHGCNTARWRDAPCGCGRWAMPGQCHWKLGRVWTLPDPVPCSGRQGLWRPAADVVEAVAVQLDAALGAMP